MDTSKKVEEALKISLPKKYARILDDPNSNKLAERFESYIDVDANSVIESNKGFIIDPNSIDDLDDGTFWGGFKRFLLYGSKKKILKHRKRWFKEWIEPKHFDIGGDGGEGMYFIKLDDSECDVYRLDLETKKVRKKPYGLNKYIEYLDSLNENNT